MLGLLGGIGDNCIIGTCSIVTKDILSNSVVAGIPAKIICNIDDLKKNKNRNVFYPTIGMSAKEKKDYLMNHVPKIN